MLRVIDKVEDKYFSSDSTVAPGGWCCWCWCCNSVNYSLFAVEESASLEEAAAL